MSLKFLAKRLVLRLFVTKKKVYIFGRRVHHSYVGALIAAISIPLFNFIGMALGFGLIVHDVISHLLVRYLGEAS